MIDRTEAFDYIVVGAGSAGAALAGRLSDDPGRRILLLDAGPDWRSNTLPQALRHPWQQFSWDVNAVPAEFQWPDLTASRTRQRAARLYIRGRGMGGTSTINGCYVIRPPMAEFDDWAAAGAKGWGSSDVLPFFVRCEDDVDFGDEPYHGRGGPVPVVRADLADWGTMDEALRDSALARGHQWEPDHNAPDALGVSFTAANIKDGARVTTNDGYLEPARDRGNLTIVGNALVDRVLFDRDQATGVVVEIHGEWHEVRGAEVVVCAGAVFSPAILQRSGIGPARLLKDLGISVRADLPVGQGLQDHAGFAVGVILKDGARPSANGMRGNCTVRYTSDDPSAGTGDVLITDLNIPAGDKPQGVILCKLAQCFARGTLAIPSQDPRALPEIQLNLLGDERDVRRARSALRTVFELVRGPGFDGKVAALVDESVREIDTCAADPALDAWAASVVRETAHTSSTCRIGPAGDPAAVVGSDLRVHGVGGLRVADLSVAPTVPRANTHLTGVMIGERAADLMRSAKRRIHD